MRRRTPWYGLTASALACAALAACVSAPEPAPTPVPVPAPAPTPAPRPTPAPAPPPFAGSWMDAPLTPGDWSYANGTATFNSPEQLPRLWFRCSQGGGFVEIAHFGAPAETMTIRTEFSDRTVQTGTIGSPRIPTSGLSGRTSGGFPANDPFLDSIAFSRGRFTVEVPGQPTLYIPSYPEITRVVEDCR